MTKNYLFDGQTADEIFDTDNLDVTVLIFFNTLTVTWGDYLYVFLFVNDNKLVLVGEGMSHGSMKVVKNNRMENEVFNTLITPNGWVWSNGL